MTNLHNQLADLAEEVIPVDLYDRVLVSSHRATVRRRILIASSAAVAVAAIASAGVAFAAGLPGPNGNGVAPAASPSDSSPPPPRVEPSRKTGEKPGEKPSVKASEKTSQSLDANASGVSVPQRLIYLDQRDNTLIRLEGSTTAPLFRPRTEDCGLVVSPDRSKIAYVISDGGGATGDLIVAGLTGDDKKTVLRNVACQGGKNPLWLPDSQQLLLQQGNLAPRVVVDVRTSKISATPFKNVTGYVAWSPNGQFAAYGEDGQVVVVMSDGTFVRSFDQADMTPVGGFSVQGISDDGRRVVIGNRNTDPSIVRSGYRLIDAQRTGRLVSLPFIAPANLKQVAIHPVPGNNLLVRDLNQGKLYLINADGKVLDSRNEPAELHSATLLSAR